MIATRGLSLKPTRKYNTICYNKPKIQYVMQTVYNIMSDVTFGNSYIRVWYTHIPRIFITSVVQSFCSLKLKKTFFFSFHELRQYTVYT